MGRIDKKSPHTYLGEGVMILGQVSKPKNKSDLIKRLNHLKNVEFQVWVDIERNELSKLTNDISRYITNKEATIIVIKKR